MVGMSRELTSVYYRHGWMHDEDIPELPQPKWDADTQATPEELLSEKQLVAGVAELVDSLTPTETKVIHLRYGFGGVDLTFDEIGRVFDLSRERIRQIESKAMRKLRRQSHESGDC